MNAWVLVGLITQLVGISCFYMAWRGLVKIKSLFTSLGIILEVLGILLWCEGVGYEFGIALGLFSIAVISWAIIVGHNFSEKDLKLKETQWRNNHPDPKKVYRYFLKFIVGVLLAGIASIFIVTLMIQILPWESANRLAFGIIALPLLWGGLCVWSYGKKSLIQPSIIMFTAASLCSINLII